jgi:hypothetical protein
MKLTTNNNSIKTETKAQCPVCGRSKISHQSWTRPDADGRWHKKRPYISCDWCDTFTWMDNGNQYPRQIKDEKK